MNQGASSESNKYGVKINIEQFLNIVRCRQNNYCNQSNYGNDVEKINTLILVPNSTLLEQWVNEIEKYIPQSNILRCSGNYNWQDKLRRMTTNDREYCIIISTIQTASQKIFKDRCSDAGNLFLIADECHMLWPPVFNTVLSEIPWSESSSRTSATPHDTTFSADLSEDYNEDEEDDEEGNARGNINPIEFFGGNKEGEAYVSNDKFTIKELLMLAYSQIRIPCSTGLSN